MTFIWRDENGETWSGADVVDVVNQIKVAPMQAEDRDDEPGFALGHDPAWLNHRAQWLQDPLKHLPRGKETSEAFTRPQIAAQRLLAAAKLLSDPHNRQAIEEVAYSLRGAASPERLAWAESVARALDGDY